LAHSYNALPQRRPKGGSALAKFAKVTGAARDPACYSSRAAIEAAE
jgi:hypothetical protein